MTKSKVKYTRICIARLLANASNALRYGSHSITCKQHHICAFTPSRRASPPFGRYSLRLFTEEWPGWVHVGGWLDWDKFYDKRRWFLISRRRMSPAVAQLLRQGLSATSVWRIQNAKRVCRIFPHQELNTDKVTHPSTNRARRIVTSLIWPTSLPTAPNRH